MIKKPLISMAIGAVVASSMGAAIADDLDVFKPKGGDRVTGNPTVYFLYQPEAEGYLIDLVGPNSTATTCDGAVAFQGYISRQGSDCLTTAGPAHLNPDVDGGDASGAFEDNKVRVCQWEAPSLAPGYYRLSVTGYDVNSNGLLADWPGAHPNATTDAALRDLHCAAPVTGLGKYQMFEVASVAAPPQAPAPKTPVAGVGCAVNTPGWDANGDGIDENGFLCRPVIKGTDSAGSVDGSATWVQIWINDKDGFNLTQEWYQITTNEQFAHFKAFCELTAGVRTCELPDQTAKLAGGSPPYTWWTRLWNPAGASAWSAPAMMTD